MSVLVGDAAPDALKIGARLMVATMAMSLPVSASLLRTAITG